MRHHEDGVLDSAASSNRRPVALERDRRSMRRCSPPEALRDFVGAWRQKEGFGPFSFESSGRACADHTRAGGVLNFHVEIFRLFPFHGPFARRSDRPPTPFPWEKLNGKPWSTSASVPRRNRNRHLYDAVAEVTGKLTPRWSCLGGATMLKLPGKLPGTCWWCLLTQLEILTRSSS